MFTVVNCTEKWIRLRLPSCRSEFESQAHHLRFRQFIELCNVEKTKINRKEAEIGPYLKKLSRKYENKEKEAPNCHL